MAGLAAYTRYLGIVLIILSIAVFMIMFNFSKYTLDLIDQEHTGSCMTYETCPHIAVLNQAYVGYALSGIIFIIGLLMAIFGGGKRGKTDASDKTAGNEKKNKWDESLKTLTGDEKLIYEKIVAADGVIFQSDLVERSGFAKAKVSRILDRMEAGGLVERKRRGMANAIVLK